MKNITALAVLVLIIAAVMSLGVREALAEDCDSTVTAPDSIQDAIDAAGVNGVVCLDDSGGAFAQIVVFSGEADSFKTLTSAHGATPVLDGSSLGKKTAITINAGVHNVTISNLQVLNFGYFGIRIFGDFNQLINVTVNLSANDGIQFIGNDNLATHTTANGNGDAGFLIETEGDVTISGSTANGNGLEGFDIHTLGNITVIDSTANNSDDDDGFGLESDGDIVVCGATAMGNHSDGFEPVAEAGALANA